MSPMGYFDRFMAWVTSTGVSDTVLHIHGGMVVLLVARLLTRRSLATPIPLACVAVAGLLKEYLDFERFGEVKPDSLVDLTNTVFWPAVLFRAK
jgi:hypothetical protein